jgi:hypothetical protein
MQQALGGVLAPVCSLLVTFLGRHIELSATQSAWLASDSQVLRVLFFFAVIQLATGNPVASAYGAFLVWLVVDVALHEQRGSTLTLDLSSALRRVADYEATFRTARG